MFRYLFLAVLALASGCRANQGERFVEPAPGQHEAPGYPREVFDKGEYPPKAPSAVNKSLIPMSGFGSPSNGGMGPYK